LRRIKGSTAKGCLDPSSADPDDVSAQIDLIGVPWLMIGEEPSAASIGGSARSSIMSSAQVKVGGGDCGQRS
jgi:hypothetical protein